MTSKRGKKRLKIQPKPGMLLAVPLFDGSVGLAHVAYVAEPEPGGFSTTCGFFAIRAASAQELKQLHIPDSVLSHPIFIRTIESESIPKGEWEIVGMRDIEYVNVNIRERLQSNWKWFDGEMGMAPMLLSMYHGLFPWDGYKKDPEFLTKRLLPGFTKPDTARYMQEFDPVVLKKLGFQIVTKQGPSPRSHSPGPWPTGPGNIVIQILYPGNGLPAVNQLERRRSVEDRIGQLKIGEIVDAGAGEGIMELVVEVPSVSIAYPLINKIISDLGLTKDTVVNMEEL